MSTLKPFLEYTLLKPDCMGTEIQQMCSQAVEHSVFAVCVPPFFVREAKRAIGEGISTKVVTVIGFPMGYTAIAAKSEEIKRAADEGADEVDAVVNIAAVKSSNWNHVRHDVESLVRTAQTRSLVLKLILEYGLLNTAEIEQLCQLAVDTQVSFLKTCTGFHGHPVTVEMVRHLRSLVPPSIKLKAAGGIRTAEMARALLEAGANRIGSSSLL